MKRMNDYTVEVDGINIYVNSNLELEKTALEELKTFKAIEGLRHLSFTPDFHKGSGTPIGTVALLDRVYPKVPGNDIGCGMALFVLKTKELPDMKTLKTKLRETFFEGKREIFVTDRKKLLMGVDNVLRGRSTERLGYDYSNFMGEFKVSDVLSPYFSITSERDNILGSIGGGNHFVEIQKIEKIVSKSMWIKYGVNQGDYCVMVHSGSLDNGHQVGTHFNDLAKKKFEGKHPKNGYFYLNDKDSEDYLTASYNAANFAKYNRGIMAAMVADVLDCDMRFIYDTPHNLVFKHDDGYMHRKGSCSADEGELVIIPGSMGTSSFVGIGNGFKGTLNSAPHGAGRILNRNKSRNNIDDLKDIELVTKIDPTRIRPDVAKEVYKGLAEEAPRSYKDIKEVIATCTAAGILDEAMWLSPVLTIKG